MARGINKVILIGNLGKDPETRSFPSGGSVTNATLATSESWKDRDGNPQEHTEWHNLVFNNKLAEIAAQYLRKGSKIYVEGSLRTRKWNKDGVDRYTTEIRVSEMQMLDSRGAGGEGGAGGRGAAPMGERSSGAGAGAGYASAPAGAPLADAGFDDDDIPF